MCGIHDDDDDDDDVDDSDDKTDTGGALQRSEHDVIGG